jgi:hypothetical protein
MLGYYHNGIYTFQEPGTNHIVDEDGQYSFPFMEMFLHD